MSTSESQNDDPDLTPETTDTTQDVAQTQQQIPEIKQEQIDLLEIHCEPEASTSQPDDNESELLIVKKPGKRKLKKEQVPLNENDRLIQLVRCMRCLYDPQHPRHRDRQVCRDLWDIIGKAMDLPGKSCEENWQTLINKFTKSKNKNRDFKDLNWLLRYISPDEAQSEGTQTSRPKQKKNSNSDGEMAFLHANDCQCNTAVLAHPMQKFLAEIASMLKKLPQQEQNLAKLKIFEIVHKFDLKKSTELIVDEIKTEIDSDD